MTESAAAPTVSSSNILPVMPLRDVVLYPHMVSPLFVGREKSIQALDAAMKNDPRRILVVAQKQPDIDDPQPAITVMLPDED